MAMAGHWNWEAPDGRNLAAMLSRSGGLSPETKDGRAEATVSMNATIKRRDVPLAFYTGDVHTGLERNRRVFRFRVVRRSVGHLSSVFPATKASLNLDVRTMVSPIL